jgi:hypothetical protein
MGDDPVPFTLAGTIVSWNAETRVLYIGGARLEVAPGAAVGLLIPGQAVTVTGYRAKREGGSWVVTEIRTSRTGF